MCTERQHDSENVKLRHENMNLKAQLEKLFSDKRQLMIENKELTQKVEYLESMIYRGVA